MPAPAAAGAESRQRPRRAVLHQHELAERLGGGDRGDDPVRRRGVTGDLDVAAETRSLARARDAQQAHAPARAVLHEEVVADGSDVAADFAEVDRLGVGQPTWAPPPRESTARHRAR